MPTTTKTPTTPEQEDLSHDPAQKHYDEEFNKIVGHQSNTAEDLQKLENYANSNVGAGIQAAEDHANAATKNIDAASSQEQLGGHAWKTNLSKDGGKKEPFKMKDLIRKKGPIGALIGLLGGGGLLAGFSGLTLLPLTIAEQFTNDTNDMHASSQRKFTSLFGGKLGPLKNKLSLCTKAVSFRCKLKTLSPDLVKRFEDNGFKFNEKTDVKGRVAFASMEFPDDQAGKAGPVVHNVQELKQTLSNLDYLSKFNTVINTRNILFLAWDGFKNVLTSLHVSKAKKIEGKNQQEVDKSYEDAIKGDKGAPPTTEAVADKADDKATEEQKKQAQANTDAGNETAKTVNEAIAKGQKIKSLALKASNALLVPQLVCLTYNMAGYISTSAKIIKAARFVTFTMIFLTLASSIKANTATESEVEKGVSILAPSQYPSTVEDPNDPSKQIPNPDIGKNATDAEAYHVVVYGDQINLTGIAVRLFVAGGFLGVLDKIVSWVNHNIGKTAIKTTCKVANSTIAKVVSFLAAPVLAVAVYGLTQILPVEQWGAALVNSAIDAAAGFDLTTNATGPTAGNIIFIGVALIMGKVAMKFGLKPGPLSAIRKNMADNQQYLEQNIALQKFEAKGSPLDVTNRYSFLGSLAFQIASFMPTIKDPISSSIGKVFGVIPTALGSLTKNANAAYSMPVANYSENRFDQCPDETYAEFGRVGSGVGEPIKPDMFCAERMVPFSPVDDPDVPEAYLKSKGWVDENGVATPGSYFEKYIKYCSEREDPWGSTAVPVEEQSDGADWYTGRQCLFDTQDNQMSSEFIGYKAEQDTTDSKIESTPDSPDTQQQAWTTQANPRLTFADILAMRLSQVGNEAAQ